MGATRGNTTLSHIDRVPRGFQGLRESERPDDLAKAAWWESLCQNQFYPGQ